MRPKNISRKPVIPKSRSLFHYRVMVKFSSIHSEIRKTDSVFYKAKYVKGLIVSNDPMSSLI